MNNLTFELIKNCTTLVKLTHLNDLCNKLTDTNSDVYALRADFGYPEHLIPKNNKKNLAYMGISKNKVDTDVVMHGFLAQDRGTCRGWV